MNHGRFQEAQRLRDLVEYQREYNNLLKQGATSSQAERGADASYRGKQQERAQSFDHLITARSGAGEAVRIGTVASAFYDTHSPRIVAALESMHATHRRQHSQALNARPAEDFSR
jgi:hypothetical protein